MIEIPVYLFTGFLESGKTSFIVETMKDPNFNDGKRKYLVITCEEGEVEYYPDEFGENVSFASFDEEQKITPDRLNAMQPRRRCDGTLRDSDAEEQPLGNMPRNSMESACPSDCAQGRCGRWGIENHPLAMVYSPCQAWRDAYPPDVALSRGTLFSELDLPLEAPKCKRGCL
jgi:hypothetical protein